jgi:hypothetical protein
VSIVVFTGPTLPAEEAEAMLACVALPPARQGDVWRAARTHQPVAIGLIDGVFLHEPAVWHREILAALAQGIHVFGAASMGALRAAELAPFGMRGVGRVFEAYRDGVWPGYADAFEDDDEVAVIHAPAALGAAPLSDAMVDVRDTLLAAEAAGVIGTVAREALAGELKRLPFPARSFAGLAERARARPDAAALPAWLAGGRVARKRLDARAMLRALAAFMASDPPPFAAQFHFETAQVWTDFVAAEAVVPTPEEVSLLDELRLRPALWRAAERAALGRLHATAVAPEPPEPAIRAQLTRLRMDRALARRADLDAWCHANAAPAAVMARLLRDEAALELALADPPPALTTAALDHLRLAGEFAPLLARARAKQAALAGMAPAPGELDAAMAWHAAQQPPLGAWQARSVAPAASVDNSAFCFAVWREYKFRQLCHGDA